jgi:predicted metalloprotease
MVQKRFGYLLSICSLLLLPVGPVFAELVVVVNAQCGIAAMSRNEVVNIFFGRNRQFFNGTEAQPVDMVDSHPDRAQFYSSLVGKSLADINAYWARQIFSGRMQQPVKMNTSEEVLKWVLSHRGGIGFIDLSKVDARVRVVYELRP